jgi:hypothetical protein
MKNSVLVLLVFSVMGTFFPGASQAAGGSEVSGGRHGARALKVCFASAGEGVDTQTLDAVTALLNEGSQSGEVTSVAQKKVGREGETFLCAEFSTFQARSIYEAKVRTFVEQGRKSPSGAPLNQVEAAVDCQKF